MYACGELLTWNFRHMANINRKLAFNEVNAQQGYFKNLRFSTPTELLTFDEDDSES